MGGAPGLQALVHCRLGVSPGSYLGGIALWEGGSGSVWAAVGGRQSASRILIRWFGVLGWSVKARSEI